QTLPRRSSVKLQTVQGEQMPLTFRRLAGRVLLCLLVIASVAAGLAACHHEQPPAKVIVLVASATRNEPRAVLAPPDEADLRQAAVTGGGVIAYVVDPNTGQPITVTLTPRRPDGQIDYGPDRYTKLAANLDQVQHLLGLLASDQPFDLLSLLARGV